jgi:DNA-binding beta-propeller fold protein YncE
LRLIDNSPLFDVALPLGANPLGIAVAGATVWVSNYSGNSISVVDAISGVVIDTIAIPSSIGINPEGIVCTGGSVYVALNSSYTIAKYDVATRAWLATYTVGKYPGWMAYNAGYLFITIGGDEDGYLLKIRESDFTTIWSAPTGRYPLAVVIPHDGTVWVGAYWGCDVTRIDEETGAVLGTYPLSGTPRGGTSDGKSVSFVVFPYNGIGTTHNLTMFDLDGVKIGEFPVGQYPRDVTFSGLNHFVANSDSLFITKL